MSLYKVLHVHLDNQAKCLLLVSPTMYLDAAKSNRAVSYVPSRNI